MENNMEKNENGSEDALAAIPEQTSESAAPVVETSETGVADTEKDGVNPTEDQTPPKDAETAPDTQTLPAGNDSPVLEKLNVLADRFRIPAWQQAALLRYTGWMDDKLVTEDEYRKELENLKNRRIGGGRR